MSQVEVSGPVNRTMTSICAGSNGFGTSGTPSISISTGAQAGLKATVVGVAVAAGVDVSDGGSVNVAVGIAMALGAADAVAVAARDAVAVTVGAADAVAVAGATGVSVTDGVAVGVDVPPSSPQLASSMRAASDAMLRFRQVGVERMNQISQIWMAA
jgi:hypothetical protein